MLLRSAGLPLTCHQPESNYWMSEHCAFQKELNVGIILEGK